MIQRCYSSYRIRTINNKINKIDWITSWSDLIERIFVKDESPSNNDINLILTTAKFVVGWFVTNIKIEVHENSNNKSKKRH